MFKRLNKRFYLYPRAEIWRRETGKLRLFTKIDERKPRSNTVDASGES